jgi:hypothetical protein
MEDDLLVPQGLVLHSPRQPRNTPARQSLARDYSRMRKVSKKGARAVRQEILRVQSALLSEFEDLVLLTGEQA